MAGWRPPVVLKPVRQGSSVGLQFVERLEDWNPALAEALRHGSEVLMEEKILGPETTVGILGGEALPVVEVRPRQGGYDYDNKYTSGRTEYWPLAMGVIIVALVLAMPEGLTAFARRKPA